MRDAMVGSVVGGLIICALSWAVVAQSASERYPVRDRLASHEAALHGGGHHHWWVGPGGH